jgi:RNA polymerase sigma factor (sigma-70 family)
MDDTVLLSRYVESGCQESFQEIVTRHSGWVFSLSLRAVRDRHLAEDVTQAVFIILARKANTIRQGTPLSGWLFKASRFAVSDALKRRARIKNRENRFAEFFKATSTGTLDDSNFADGISQTLDEAVACLSESDRQAILLRFYEHKSLAEIGTILTVSEEAAKKRVARAVERLRKYFSTRGIMASAALLLLLLSRRSAEAAGGVPMIASSTAAAPFAQSIANGALQLMAHANARLLGAILAASLALLIAVPTLGGALVRIATAPPATAPAPVRARALPEVPFETTEVKRPRLPADSRFADLWIGYKGELLWRSDAYASPPTLPFLLKSAEKQERPYAVAVDPQGNFFIKPLDQAILQSPVIRQSLFDYDNGPMEPAARVRDMLSVIEPMPSASSDASRIDALPSLDSKKLIDKDWHKLHRQEQEDGTSVLEVTPSRFQMINPSSYGSDSVEFQDFGNPILVPEPAAGLIALAAAGLLTLRRRRRQCRKRANIRPTL